MLTNRNDQTNQLTNIEAMHEAGKAANTHAANAAFADYQGRKSSNTTRRQTADLACFSEYLLAVGVVPGDLVNEPESWRGVTWGLVAGFVKWQLKAGYAIGSINVRLATVKGYAKLATQAGTLDPTAYAMIMTVKGYSHKEAVNVDQDRQSADVGTRKGDKKAEAVSINPAQAKALLTHPNTPQGRRDTFLMAIMLEHGLRVGEVALLTVTAFDMTAGTFTFYRPKVGKTQTHRMTQKTLTAAKAYFENDAPVMGCVWRGSLKGQAGKLTNEGMSERAITARVRDLGAAVGLVGLSAHDLRHAWATQAARNGTAIDRLQDAGGWSSPAMPMRYIEAAKVANEGVRLE